MGLKTRSKEASAKVEKVAHVALHAGQFEAVAGGDLAVLVQLSRRGVEQRDPCAGGGKDRRLLAAGRGQAEDLAAAYVAQPVSG